MEELKTITNLVKLTGKLSAPFTFDHESHGEGFYSSTLEVSRLSGYSDLLPLIVSEKLINDLNLLKNSKISIVGEFRSRNEIIGDKSKLVLFVFVTSIQVESPEVKDNNEIEVNGYLCKTPVYRTTPLNREISDFILAVNRGRYNKSDYLPAIVWGRNARFMSSQEVGSQFEAKGRIQSREYVSGSDKQTHIAYEISIGYINKIRR